MLKLYDYYVSDDDARQIAGLNNAIKTKFFKLLDVMRQKKNTTINTTISPRTVNYWTEIGVLDKSPLQESNKWHKFSFVDIVFIHLAGKLRDFGLNLEKIKITKHNLYRLISLKDENGTEVFKTPLSVLETAILLAFALKNHGNIYLLITNSGQATYTTEESLILNREHHNLPDAYIYLNLNDLLNKNEIINNIRAEIRHETQKYALDDKEKQVLSALKQNDTQQVVVTKDLQNGALSKMITTQNSTNTCDATIIRAIKKVCAQHNLDFGGLQFTIQNGEIIRETNTKTTIFK